MKLPYILIADDNIERRNSFVTAFEKQVAYAAVSTVDDGQSLLSFLTDCGWKDLPSLLVLNYYLRDTTAPDLIRELLVNTRYLKFPKIVYTPAGDPKEINECRILGVRHFLTLPGNVFELENNIRRIDDLLKSELNLV